MKVSPHTHVESPLTGSTIQNMVKRAKALGRTHFAYTDHGHLSSALKTYNQCKKNGLKFIPGIELYFKDGSCQIVSGTPANRCRYFTISLYCQDQAAYQELCKQVSRTDLPTIMVHGEKQQLWGWNELQYMSQFNTCIVLGGPHCIVGKAMLAGAPEAGMKVFERLLTMFTSQRLNTSILCEPWSKQFNTVVEVKYSDGTKDALLASDLVTTNKARRIKAIDLADRGGHFKMESLTKGNTYYEVGKNIDSVKIHKGFLPLPGGDAILKVNKFLSALGTRYGVNALVTDYAYYANKEDKIVQTMRLEGSNKLQPNLHMKTVQEIGDYLTQVLGWNPADVDNITANNDAWAKQFDSLTLKYEWRLAETDGSPIQKIMAIIKENGRMKWDDPKYMARLKEEIDIIHRNGVYDLSAYFLPIRDVLNHYKDNGRLTGPGRGSAGGSLLCYLMGITQIDPFKYDLPFQRFFSMVRIKGKKLPDIDVDLEDRELLVGEDGKSGYLYGRWGDKAAQISTRTTIRLKSAILDTNRYFNGKVEDSIQSLTKGFPAPPQGVTDHQFVFGYEDTDENHIPGLIETSEELKKYSEERPKEWEIVSKAMGLTRAYSKHASAFVISDVPIKNIIPVKEGNITQYEAKEVEEAGLIKYDFLVVSQLKDVRVALDLINKKSYVEPKYVGWYHSESDSGACFKCDNVEKALENSDGFVEPILKEEVNQLDDSKICWRCKKRFKDIQLNKATGFFDHDGKETFIWDLPELPEVFKSTWAGHAETLFQINTASMKPHLMNMLPQNIMDLATLLALVRPGPLDFVDEKTGRNMVEEYMLRRRGEAEPDIKEMAELLPSTYGILAFQEQLGTIARDLAGFPGEEAELLRENMAKKKMVELMKMKPAFMEGAKKKVSEETAEAIWERMVTFGRYGFSVIHAVEYAHITYACMFLKHFYPLEWWAAVLTNATQQEITGKFWPYVRELVAAPDINLSSDAMTVDYANEKIRAKMGIVRGMAEKTIQPIVEGRPYANIQEFVDKKVAGQSLSHKLIHVGILDSLFPPKITLTEKLKMYEDAVEIRAFKDKVAKAEAAGKKTRATQPKEGQVPVEYLNLHPLQEAAMKKAVLPSMPLNLFELGAKYSKVLAPYNTRPLVMSARGYETILINGDQLQRLDEIEGENIKDDIYVAATCFVVEAKEFSYSKNTKRALKLVLDADGYVSEKVLWPEYESGKLVYPPSLKKGAIATFFLRKRAGKKDLSIMSVVVETEEKPKEEPKLKEA